MLQVSLQPPAAGAGSLLDSEEGYAAYWLAAVHYCFFARSSKTHLSASPARLPSAAAGLRMYAAPCRASEHAEAIL